MENLKKIESFGRPFNKDEDDVEEFINDLVSFVERRVFSRISKRVNFLLTRINGQKVEMVADGNSDKDEDGNWRTRIDSNGNFLFEKRISGTWTEANKIAGS